MATLREYFDTDFNRCLSVHKPWGLKDASGRDHGSITARISQDFDANAKYWSFFVLENNYTNFRREKISRIFHSIFLLLFFGVVALELVACDVYFL